MKQTIKYYIYCSPNKSYSAQESELITFAEQKELNIVGTYHGDIRPMLLRIQKGFAQGIIVSNIFDLPITPLLKSLIDKNIIRDIKYPANID